MTTANAIIRSALGKLGIVGPGEPVKPADAESCLLSLNTLIDAWRIERLYAYDTQTTTYTTTAETQTLTIGPAGDIVVPSRPERFEQGCYLSFGSRDYDMTQVNEAEFNSVSYKAITAIGPVSFVYNPALPAGLLRFFPRIPAGAVLHLVAQVQISALDGLSTVYSLPAGYERALIFTLAEEVAADFEREVPPTVARNATNARRLLKRANHTVPNLQVGDTIRANSNPLGLYSIS